MNSFHKGKERAVQCVEGPGDKISLLKSYGRQRSRTQWSVNLNRTTVGHHYVIQPNQLDDV
jgi:hypothetical protein